MNLTKDVRIINHKKSECLNDPGVTTGAKLLQRYQGTRPVRAARRGGVVTDAGEPWLGPIGFSENMGKPQDPVVHSGSSSLPPLE